MSGTTYSLIRARQADVLRSLTPTTLGVHQFRPYEGQDRDFPEWAAASNGPFRTFEILHGGDYEAEKYLDRDTDYIEHTEEVLVCYPRRREFEGHLLDDIIDQDFTDIRKAIGRRGYGEYEGLGSGLHRCTLVATQIEDRPGARLLRARYLLAYDRSM
jgi:hypothetical protein